MFILNMQKMVKLSLAWLDMAWHPASSRDCAEVQRGSSAAAVSARLQPPAKALRSNIGQDRPGHVQICVNNCIYNMTMTIYDSYNTTSMRHVGCPGFDIAQQLLTGNRKNMQKLTSHWYKAEGNM